MKNGVQWLIRVWHLGRLAEPVAGAYRTLFAPDGSPQGKLVLADLAEYCNVQATSFVPGDPAQTAFNEGARDAYLHIVELAGLKPSEIPKLGQEGEN